MPMVKNKQNTFWWYGLGLVSIITIFIIRLGASQDKPVIENQPHLDESGSVHPWFINPEVGRILRSSSDRLAIVGEVVSRAEDMWIGAGMPAEASKNAGTALERVLKFIIDTDTDALIELWRISSLTPNTIARNRLESWGRHMYQTDPERWKMWNRWDYETKYRDAIDKNANFTIQIDAIGDQVLAGMGYDYLKTVTHGFQSLEILATHLPKPNIVGDKRLYSSGRTVSCAIPVSVHGLGRLWLEIVLQENANDAFWHVSQAVLWIPPSTKRAPDQVYLLAL